MAESAASSATPSAALRALRDRWADSKAAERSNAQSYLREFCLALGVPEPLPAGSGYEFELPVKLITRDGTETQGFIDCYKQGHFILEAKDVQGGASDVALRRAYGQARQYAANDPSGSPPPYLLVLDVAKTLLVFHRWGGTYQGFAAGHRIDLSTLDERAADIALLQDIWQQPSRRDPRLHAQAVTQEIATKLARLAAALEARAFEPERVARFLMRVVFSCFAEDVDLLPREAFRQTVQNAGMQGDPVKFQRALEGLWRAMDEGGMFGFESILRFNGHFFSDAEALPLERAEIALLLEAAKADWKHVEPTIFGTLLTRALDPEERHRLGAEYTPRAFIERLVRPTVEEPVRERWTAVQADVLQLRESGKPKDRAAAEQRLREFLAWLQGLRVLDPACGSGNFLYVTMHVLKDIEYEIMREIESLTGLTELRMHEIGPRNFLGIEVKPWAREIAELTLWIGFHQFWKQHHAVQPPEPVLQDTGTLELRDAVLAWDEIRHVPAKDRPDPTPRIVHPVTGELVPDPEARLPYMEYVGARQAEWPEADFIVGNPPYLGKSRQREAFGEGYVDALRSVYTDVPDSADLVMYWWHRAARAVASGRTIRAGLITTNSITQKFHQPLISAADEAGARIVWAIPDHPWSDEVGGADVRVAMTVLGATTGKAMRLEADEDGTILRQFHVPRLNPDLSVGADLTSMRPLRAMEGLSVPGMQLDGAGFVLEARHAESLLADDPRLHDVIRPYRNGRDLMATSRDLYVIDFGMMTEDEARAYPVPFDIVRTLVYPQRQANAHASDREDWWRFARTRPALREALAGLSRFIVTTRTSRRRVFSFMPAGTVPDSKIVCIAASDAHTLGVLSSSVHVLWAMAAGGRLGVGNDASYDKARCFDPFPFPDATPAQRTAISDLADRIDGHRTDAMRRAPEVTLTNMYAVIQKLQSGAPLTAKERSVHTLGACSSLKDLHDQLDAAVAEAYGWPWPLSREAILERLVALHDQRVAEEAVGHVRWLRPDYQIPRFGADLATADALIAAAPAAAVAATGAAAPLPWPTDAVGQITAVRALAAAAPISPVDAAIRFEGARFDLVQRHLETLAMLGEVRDLGDGRFAVAAGGGY